MKAIYFKLKDSSLSSVASNGEGDKDGALWCRPLYVVNVTKRGGMSEGEVRKELEGIQRQKVGKDRSNREDKPLEVVWGGGE